MQKLKTEKLIHFLSVPNLTAFSFLLLTLVTAGRYGFFGDELYYFACSKHLAFGYVDHPPLVAILTFISVKIFGETLIGLRFLSGLAGAGTVLIASHISKSLGGNKFSQSLAALLILFSAGIPAISSFFSMNPVDIFLCSLFILLFIKIIDDPSPKKWIILGLVLGIGLLNKYTFMVLGFSTITALMITKHWRYFKSPWLYISFLIGFLLFLPHIIWQIDHSFPTLEFMKNATSNKNLSLSPLTFILQLILGLNPFTFPIWLSGIIFLTFGKHFKKYHIFGWMAILFLAVYMTQNSKVYYAIPIFPLLFAAGSIVIEKWVEKYHMNYIKWVTIILIVISGTVLMPLFVPILPVEQFVSYSKTIGVWDYIKMEQDESDLLPLHFIYRFGWPEMVELVAETYHSLPIEDQADETAILASWYGPAGAIDHFGQKLGLPPSICGRNNYWIWGFREYTGECIISVGFNVEQMKQFYNDVRVAANFIHPYAYNLTICICKDPKFKLEEIWHEVKVYN